MKRTESSIANYVELICKLAQDYEAYSAQNSAVPDKLTYKVSVPEETPLIERNARIAALTELTQESTITKTAFDTRRIDQETSRNPRENLQYWSRSDQFIDQDMQDKIEIFANMLKPLDELKESFGTQPEWHSSYARALYDAVYRILRIKEADLDIFRPQVAYLEQLMFARYRLSMEELSKISSLDFKNIILKKDENLLKRGAYLHMTKAADNPPKTIIKDSDGNMQQNIVNAIFGNNNFRRDGERTVERTITITIKDQVID